MSSGICKHTLPVSEIYLDFLLHSDFHGTLFGERWPALQYQFLYFHCGIEMLLLSLESMINLGKMVLSVGEST